LNASPNGARRRRASLRNFAAIRHNQAIPNTFCWLLEQNDGVIPQPLTTECGCWRDAGAANEILRQVPKQPFTAVTWTGVYHPARETLSTSPMKANRLRDEYISTEHIFLAVIGEATPLSPKYERFGHCP
jgi:hypothetical protein